MSSVDPSAPKSKAPRPLSGSGPPRLPIHPPLPGSGGDASSSTSAAPGSGPEKKPQRQMTKAERRELQERQRAAKAAAKAEGGDKPKAGKKDAAGSKKDASASAHATAASSSGSGARAAGGSGSIPTSASRASFGGVGGGAGGSGGGAGSVGANDDGAASRPRGLRIFSHFALQRPPTTGAKGDVHPSIVRLGLMFASFRICGANARCIATLTAFKEVIQDYTTPAGTTLARHLTTHLSAQISHLVAARPMAVTMGNAIRQLKLEISGSDIDLPEQDAKDALCLKIDDYIRDRIIIADQVIQETATSKIQDGDVVLTYARSSVVEKILLGAWEDEIQFSVFVVDSRPMLEGKRLLSILSRAGIPCTYLLLPALGSVITEVSTVFLGAHSIHSNGAVYSRAGTALVAMLAKRHSVPVVVCCETYKFSDNVQLDGFTKNELAPLQEFQFGPPTGPSLDVLYPLYDLTPPASITAVVTEVGVIPPDSISSIPLALGRTVL